MIVCHNEHCSNANSTAEKAIKSYQIDHKYTKKIDLGLDMDTDILTINGILKLKNEVRFITRKLF